MNTPEQNHYLQVGLANKKHCDMKNRIGYTFEECPECIADHGQAQINQGDETMNAKVTELKNKAQKIVKAQSLEILVESFEMTNEKMEAARGNDNEYLAIAETREWIMNELETRNPEAFEKWVDGNEDSPRKFFI